MDNSETLSTLGTQDTGRRKKTQHRKLKRLATRTATKKEVNLRAGDGEIVSASYKTPAVLLIYLYIYYIYLTLIIASSKTTGRQETTYLFGTPEFTPLKFLMRSVLFILSALWFIVLLLDFVAIVGLYIFLSILIHVFVYLLFLFTNTWVHPTPPPFYCGSVLIIFLVFAPLVFVLRLVPSAACVSRLSILGPTFICSYAENIFKPPLLNK